MNLLDTLTQHDITLIENYAKLYGDCGDNFVGVDAYLSEWSKHKEKLWKLMGRQLIVKIPIELKKDEALTRREYEELFRAHPFSIGFREKISELCNASSYYPIYSLVESPNVHKLNVVQAIRLTREKDGKELKICEGTRPTKALSQIVKFLGKENFGDLDDFILALSRIKNDLTIKGNLVFSIHPMDFMTMSDNSSDWSSCMSWKGDGCYRAGTVEMMNSNNVVCCYLESRHPFIFTDVSYIEHKGEKVEDYTWNNKKWRQLAYVTKDIIVTGKAYPYQKKELSLAILNGLGALAKENIGWTYDYGPQLYKDMLHISGTITFEKAHSYIYENRMTKKNILFESKGMYNDMLNDHDTAYYCIRNKVKHNKIISYSGKALCTTCGGKLLTCESCYGQEYNDRYEDAGNLKCYTCITEGTCRDCGTYLGKGNLIKCKRYLTTFYYCQECLDKYYKKCPGCGGWYDTPTGTPQFYFRVSDKDIYLQDTAASVGWKKLAAENKTKGLRVMPGYCCEECARYLARNHTLPTTSSYDIGEVLSQEVVEDKTRSWVYPTYLNYARHALITEKVFTKHSLDIIKEFQPPHEEELQAWDALQF